MTANGRLRRNIRRLAAVGMSLALAGPAAAQSDRLDREKAIFTVADQKAAADIAATIAECGKLSRTPAVRRLKEAMLGIDLSVAVTPAKRKELVAKLQAAIDVAEGKAPAPAGEDPKAAGVKLSAREAFAAAEKEWKDVDEGLRKAATMNDRGQSAEARMTVDTLAAKYPNNPALFASRQQDFFGSQIAAERDLARQYAKAWTESMRSVERSAVPLAGDIQFPDKKTWDTITRLRQTPGVKLTPKEEELLSALNTKVTVNFRGKQFEEALQELSNDIRQPIHVDKKSLEDLGLDLSRGMTFTGNVTARTALRGILQSQGLTFIVKDEMIQVLTLEKAQQTLVTRSYYLGDLIQGTGQFGNAVQWGPYLSYQQTADNAQKIVEAIQTSIDPLAWRTDRSNGPCTVSFHLPTLSLVVRASAEVHASLGNSLGGGRK